MLLRRRLGGAALLLGLVAGSCSAPPPTVGGTATPATTPAPIAATASAVPLTPAAAATQSTTARISMGDNFFTPDTITVAVGTTVTWQIDSGEAQHDVKALGGAFVSDSPMAPEVAFSFTFTQPGEYAYVCTFHINEGMIGKVIVK